MITHLEIMGFFKRFLTASAEESLLLKGLFVQAFLFFSVKIIPRCANIGPYQHPHKQLIAWKPRLRSDNEGDLVIFALKPDAIFVD